MRSVSTTDYWHGRALSRVLHGEAGVGDLVLIRSLLTRSLTTTRFPTPMKARAPWEQPWMGTTTKANPNRLDLNARARYEVTLSHGTHAAIEEEIRDAYRAFQYERYETGGYLFGLNRPRHARSHLCHATGPGPGSLHGSRSMQLARAEIVEAELPDRLAHLRYAGMWHTHPRGPLTPSNADRDAWATLMERQGWSRHVAVIAGPGSEGFGWSYPDYTAWVTRPDYDPATGKRIGTVCEPARIEFNVL